MNNNFLIAGIILCSFAAGYAGSYLHEIGQSHQLSYITQKETQSFTHFSELENSVTKILPEVSQSVVSIIIKKDLDIYRQDPFGIFREKINSIEKQIGGGTGFFVRSDGTILTNKHVVAYDDLTYYAVLSTGEEYELEILGRDPVNDLAIAQIKNPARKSFTALKLTQNNSIKTGNFVIAIGNALTEFQNSVSLGIISGKNRSITADGNILSGLLQTDAAINPGNSGGPLISLSGEVVGINTAVAAKSDGIGFAIPLSERKIDYFIESIKEHGEIKRPFIGINFVQNSEAIASEYSLPYNYGAFVRDTDSQGNAAKKGIKAGDLILEINGQKLLTQTSLTGFIQNSLPGDEVILKIARGDTIQDISLTLSAL